MTSTWPVKALEDVGVAALDCEHKTPPDAGQGHPYIAIPNLVDGRLDLRTVRRITDDQLREWTRRTKPLPGDVIVTRRGRVGDTAVIPTDLECAIGQNLVILRSDGTQLDQRYLRWASRGPLWHAEVDRLLNVGAVFDSLNVRDLPKICVPVPPLDAQAAIADVLEALDDKIAANATQASLALQLAVAEYQRGIAGSLDDIGLGDAGKWLSGGTPSTKNPDYWDGPIPWISASNLKTFFLATSDRTVTELGAQSGTRVVSPGTLLFVVRGMSLKSEFRMGVAQREVAFGQDSKAIIVDDRLPATTVAIGLFAKRDEVLTLVDEAGHGTGRLPTDRLQGLRIPLPPPERAQPLEDALSALVAVGAAAEEENRQLALTRDSLLPPLLSGDLRTRRGPAVAGENM